MLYNVDIACSQSVISISIHIKYVIQCPKEVCIRKQECYQMAILKVYEILTLRDSYLDGSVLQSAQCNGFNYSCYITHACYKLSEWLGRSVVNSIAYNN